MKNFADYENVKKKITKKNIQFDRMNRWISLGKIDN